MRVPNGNGSVYTIAPLSNQEAHRNVHRDMLKPHVKPQTPPEHTQVEAPAPGASLSESLDESEAWVWGPVPVAAVCPDLAPMVGDSVAGARPGNADNQEVQVASPTPVLRRTTRATAGQHSNRHHLPRAIADPGSGSTHS